MAAQVPSVMWVPPYRHHSRVPCQAIYFMCVFERCPTCESLFVKEYGSARPRFVENVKDVEARKALIQQKAELRERINASMNPSNPRHECHDDPNAHPDELERRARNRNNWLSNQYKRGSRRLKRAWLSQFQVEWDTAWKAWCDKHGYCGGYDSKPCMRRQKGKKPQ